MLTQTAVLGMLGTDVVRAREVACIRRRRDESGGLKTLGLQHGWLSLGMGSCLRILV